MVKKIEQITGRVENIISPEAQAKKDLIKAIETILNQLKAQFNDKYEISSFCLEISFNNRRLHTKDNGTEPWTKVLTAVAKELKIDNFNAIDSYGSGDGGTVSFDLKPCPESKEIIELYQTGFAGESTGQLKGLKQKLVSVTVDIDAVNIFKK